MWVELLQEKNPFLNLVLATLKRKVPLLYVIISVSKSFLLFDKNQTESVLSRNKSYKKTWKFTIKSDIINLQIYAKNLKNLCVF